MLKLQSRIRTCVYRPLPRRGTSYPPSKCIFTPHQYLTGIYQAYTKYIHTISLLPPSCGPSWSPQARLDVSDLDFLRILSVLATESPPTLGWGLPKFHSPSFISHTWLPLRDTGPWPSTHPNSKVCFCRPAYLHGIEDVVLPSGKQGKSGTCPRRSSTLPT